MHRLIAIALVVLPSPTPAMSGRVTCTSRSMVVCQDGFCFASFDAPSEPGLSLALDFDRMTYVIPQIDLTAKPIKPVSVEQAVRHYDAKFAVELADKHVGHVEFTANTNDDGQLEMSAASRYAYPGTEARSPIVAVTTLRCALEHGGAG